MNGKRLAVILISILMVFSLAACNSDKADSAPQASITDDVSENTDRVTESIVSDGTTAPAADNTATTAAAESENADDPAEWSTAQIVEFYKNAAAKTTANAKSSRAITLKDVSINNGEYESAINFIMPIMGKLISNNSEEVDGITGGFANLTEADVASAKAYKSGNNIAVEMVMKKQVSGPREDANSGTVGHAITAVGDIGQVVTQLTDLGLPLELSYEDTKIYYTNPVVKVVIDGNGKIISGTWSYTVEISMNNYKAFGKPVNSTSVIMDNKITLI